MHSHDTQRLAELIATKHELLVQMRDLGRLQSDLIDAADFTQLLKVLTAKQRVLSAIQSTERELTPFRTQDPAARSWSSPQQRQRCAGLAARCEAIFHEIVEQEKLSEARLETQRNEASQRLHGAHSASQARGAYVSQSQSSRSMLDISSGK